MRAVLFDLDDTLAPEESPDARGVSADGARSRPA